MYESDIYGENRVREEHFAKDKKSIFTVFGFIKSV